MMVPALMAWLAGYDGGQPAQSNAPQSIEVKPVAPAPTAKPVTPAEPQDLLFSALPECRSGRQARPVGEAMERMVGKKVVLRGVLIWGPRWSCECESCSTTLRVVDPAARALDPPATALLIERKGEPRPWQVFASVSASPEIDVIATGILHPAAMEHSKYYNDFLLGDAELCRLRADPKRPKTHVPHPAPKVYEPFIGCPGSFKL